MKVTIKYVGPRLAEQLLATNAHNRHVSPSRVETLANEMRSGKWQLNGETIVVSETGRLLDGQHRLYAILESECTIQMAIAEGVPDNSFETIDTGRARSGGDIAGMVGIANPSVAVAGAGIIWRLYHHANVSEPCPAYAALRVIERYPSITKWAMQVGAPPRILAPASFLAALAYLEDVAQKPALAARFYKSIHDGAGLEELDPCLVLRNRMLALRGDKTKMSSYVTWNAVARALSALEGGDKIQRLVISTNTGAIRRPDMWDYHMARLAKDRRLDDVPAPEQRSGGKGKARMNHMVRELRARANKEGSESPEAA